MHSYIQNVVIAATETHTISVTAGQTLHVMNPDDSLRISFEKLNVGDGLPHFIIPKNTDNPQGFNVLITATELLYYRHDSAVAGNVYFWVV